jgi:outer membrane protein OmpA-like peptidoglycan-associated protein
MKSRNLRREKLEILTDSETSSVSSFKLEEANNTVESANFDEFSNLRILLLSQEQDKISQLETRVKNLQLQLDSLPPATSDEVSNVLPKAIKTRNKLDNKLSNATLPLVVENIRQSVSDNPQVLADALFPAIGPSIRKAIAEALQTMVQSLNQTIEYSFSPRSIKWRIEAFQTGKSFGEIVLLNTLLYRVEEIFLIHKETGVLLQHVSAILEKGQDADMVSAMLTAIQDFVTDSFSNSTEATLDTLTLGELSVWIERSPDLLFAAVIRGNAPLTLREQFKTSLEKIDFEHEDDLQSFNGNIDIFEVSRPVLQECLQYQLGSETGNKSSFFTPFNVGIGFLSLVILALSLFLAQDYWRWSKYITRLRNESGIVVTNAERGWFRHSVQGMRDSLAINPVDLFQDYGINSAKTDSRWEEYQSHNADIVLKRAKKILNPPDSIILAFSNGVLLINGSAPKEWFDDTKKIASAISGVTELKMNTSPVSDIVNQIESQRINFVCKSTEYDGNQSETLKKLSVLLSEFSTTSAQENLPIGIEIHGFSNRDGTNEANLKISKQRAENVRSSLIADSNLAKKLDIKVIGKGFDEKSANNGCSAQIKVMLNQ